MPLEIGHDGIEARVPLPLRPRPLRDVLRELLTELARADGEQPLTMCSLFLVRGKDALDIASITEEHVIAESGVFQRLPRPAPPPMTH
eukprot:9086955-Alexandrium_andersonii.AAC.1